MRFLTSAGLALGVLLLLSMSSRSTAGRGPGPDREACRVMAEVRRQARRGDRATSALTGVVRTTFARGMLRALRDLVPDAKLRRCGTDPEKLAALVRRAQRAALKKNDDP